MANRCFSTPTLKEEEDTMATREALFSEELQRRLEKIINMLSLVNYKDFSDFGGLEGDQELPPYDKLVKSTYTAPRPQFLSYRPKRKEDGEDLQEKHEGMESSKRSPCSKIMILILVAVLFVLIVCLPPWRSSKLYADLNLQVLNESANGFGLPIGENSKELDLPITNELGELTKEKDLEESGLLINENTEQFSISNEGDEALVVFTQFGTPKFESTYSFGAHSTILIGQSGTLVWESPDCMEALMSEEKGVNEWLLDALVAEDSKHLGVWRIPVAQNSKHLGDVLVAEDSKHMGAVLSRTSIKALGIPLLYAITGAFFCAAAVVIYWYKKRAIYASPMTSLEPVKKIQAKRNNRTEQGPLKQLSKMQMKGSSVCSVQLLNEYSTAHTVSSSAKKKDNMLNEADSASTTKQENMTTREINMENSSYRSSTTLAKKDADKKQLKEIPLRRSERIRNSTKSDCARRQHA